MILVAFTCKPKCFSFTVRPQGKTVDSDVMVEYLQMTGKCFLRLENLKKSSLDLLWQMNNARPCKSKIIQDFTTRRGLTLVKQSPYGLDLNLYE